MRCSQTTRSRKFSPEHDLSSVSICVQRSGLGAALAAGAGCAGAGAACAGAGGAPVAAGADLAAALAGARCGGAAFFGASAPDGVASLDVPEAAPDGGASLPAGGVDPVCAGAGSIGAVAGLAASPAGAVDDGGAIGLPIWRHAYHAAATMMSATTRITM